MAIRCQLDTVEDTKIVAACVAGLFAGDGQGAQTICLRGALGAGKSEFARHVISWLCDVDIADIPSPTFTLVQHYQTHGGRELWHMDLYRLTHPDEVWALGVEQGFETALCLIEWPDRIEPYLPHNRIDIDIAFSDSADESRIMDIDAKDTGWLAGLADAFGHTALRYSHLE